MQTQNLPFVMIISTIILIRSFYLYFPQGLAVLLVSYHSSSIGLSAESTSGWGWSHQPASGVSSALFSKQEYGFELICTLVDMHRI